MNDFEYPTHPPQIENPKEMSQTIPATLIPGDGIGPEIMDSTLAVLEALGAPFQWDRQTAGSEGVKSAGDPLPPRPSTASSARGWRSKGRWRLRPPAVIDRRMCGCASNSSSMPICGRRELSSPAADSTTLISLSCAKISRACTSDTRPTFKSTMTRTPWPWPRASTRGKAAAACSSSHSRCDSDGAKKKWPSFTKPTS